MSNKIVFLTGSGASVPYLGLRTKDLTEALLTKEKWLEIISFAKGTWKNPDNYIHEVARSKQAPDNLKVIDFLDDFEDEMLDDLLQLLKNVYRTDKLDFEFLIYFIDEITGYFKGFPLSGFNTASTDSRFALILAAMGFEEFHYQDETKTKKSLRENSNPDFEKFSQTLNFFNSFLERIQDKHYRHYPSFLPTLAREIIAREIRKIWSNIDTDDYQQIRSFFESHQIFQDESFQVDLFTLNYDPLLYELTGSEFTDFFEETTFEIDGETSTGNYKCFNRNFQEHLDKGNPSINFLHGHLGLLPNFNSSLPENFRGFRNILFTSDYKLAARERILGTWKLQETDPSGFRKRNSCLITGHHKHATLNNPPFTSYFDHFSLSLEKSDAIIVVGYSFRDPHINSLLRAHHRKNNSLLIIDEGEMDRSFSKKISGVFPSETEKDLLKIKDSVNLKDLGNNLHISLGGASGCFRENPQILNSWLDRVL